MQYLISQVDLVGVDSPVHLVNILYLTGLDRALFSTYLIVTVVTNVAK